MDDGRPSSNRFGEGPDHADSPERGDRPIAAERAPTGWSVTRRRASGGRRRWRSIDEGKARIRGRHAYRSHRRWWRRHKMVTKVKRGLPPTPSGITTASQGSGVAHETYRSSGARPVRFAIRPSMRGPISSSSWNAKTTSGQSGFARVRWDPDWRFNCHPVRSSAASTRRAFNEGQLVKRPGR